MASVLEQLSAFWQNQSLSRRITIVALMASALILTIVFSVWASQPSFSVAFSGLGEEDAAQIVESLKEQNIPYQLRNSSTILVPSDQVYEVRLNMANRGLPKSSSVGYELFNSNTMVMTEFTQQVNYQRAIEGELERTINSLESIEASRVHIVTPERALLIEDQQPATASVTLQIKAGQYITQAQVNSIKHLVASSVEGLLPESIVIVDSSGALLAGGQTEGEMAIYSQSDAQLSAEQSAAAQIESKVQTMLDAVLGANRSIVKANVAMDWTQRETSTTSYNPDENVLRSAQSINETYTTTGTGGGVPGADTNLPEDATVVNTTGQLMDYSRTEETTNYEITESQTVEIQQPGEIQKIALSVMIDGVDDDEQLSILRAAVIAAAGIDEDVRGDILSVRSMAFDRTYLEEQEVAIAAESRTDLYFKIAEYAIPIAVILILLFFIWRLFRNLRMATTQAWMPVMQTVSEAALAAPGAGAQGLIGAGALMLDDEEEEMPEIGMPSLPILPEAKVSTPSPEDEQLIRIMTRLAEESPSTVAEIIQLWLNEDEK